MTPEEKELILVTGGARAGKSDFAQKLAHQISVSPTYVEADGGLPLEYLSPQQQIGTSGDHVYEDCLPDSQARKVLFVATAEPRDAEMEERIRRHRSSRPTDWNTLEEPIYLAEAIARTSYGVRVVLVDCLNLWISNLLLGTNDEDLADVEQAALDSAERLLDCYEGGAATFILVSNEVGMGLVPSYPLGRNFRDVLGKVNQVVAARADKVYLLVAGLSLELKSLSSRVLLPKGDSH